MGYMKRIATRRLFEGVITGRDPESVAMRQTLRDILPVAERGVEPDADGDGGRWLLDQDRRFDSGADARDGY